MQTGRQHSLGVEPSSDVATELDAPAFDSHAHITLYFCNRESAGPYVVGMPAPELLAES
ncbi:MAG: hypothetical protein RL701_155 [Pseudomonadota bacterium]